MIRTLPLLYFAAVLAIGVWAARRTRNHRDYFVAGRRLGLWLTGLGTTAAAFSGVVFIGGPGLTYRWGLASFFIWISVGFTAGLLCWTVARPLHRLARERGVLTIPDAIFERYGCRRSAGLAASAIVVGCIGYLGAQLLALGLLLQTLLGLSLPLSLGIGLAVLVAYSAAGGMIAGAYTDLLQGVLMALAAGAVFVSALAAAGGWSAMTATLVEARGAEFLAPYGGRPALAGLGLLFVFGIGVLGQPHMLHRFLMLDDERKLRWLPLVLGGGQSAVLLVWIGIGLAVPALVAAGRLAEPARADLAAPALLAGALPPWVAGLAFVAVLAAIMSTADSFLNVAAGALARDLPRAFGRTPPAGLAWARAATAGVAVAAAALALTTDSLIALLGTWAFGSFAAALAPSLALGLNWPRAGATAASVSIAAGLGLNVGLEWVERIWPGSLLAVGAIPSAVALAASFLLFVVVGWWRGV